MWKTLTENLMSSFKTSKSFLVAENILQHQLRTTYILKRKHPTQLYKRGEKPKTLRSRHYIYDFIKHVHAERQPNIDVILNAYVEGLGNSGDKVSVRPHYAYNNLLLTGLAVYANPENLRKIKDKTQEKDENRYSSVNASLTVKIMSRIMLSVVMNKDMPWVLKPWHVKASFRKCGYVVPEEALTLPEEPIKGPNMNIENKEFFVTVMVNHLEKVNVRCRIHHWSTDVTDRLPYIQNFWEIPSEAIFAEQVSVLKTFPPKTV